MHALVRTDALQSLLYFGLNLQHTAPIALLRNNTQSPTPAEAAQIAAQLLASREALAERRREGRVAQQLPDGTRLAVLAPGAVPWDHGSCDLRVEARR